MYVWIMRKQIAYTLSAIQANTQAHTHTADTLNHQRLENILPKM